MNTFRQFEQQVEHIPLATGWYLADPGEARGRQELFTRQEPQKLKALRDGLSDIYEEHFKEGALPESEA
jgi:hypothetical protein